jgi:MFS family permease
MYTTLLMVPFFIEEVQDKGTALSGVLLGTMSVVVAVISPLGGRLSDGWGRRPSAQLGAFILLGGTVALLVGLSPDVPAAYIAGSLAVFGLGLGLGVGAAGTAAVEAAPRSLAGSASGTNSMMRYAGSIVGAGILSGVLSSDAAGGDVATFRIVMAAVVATAALACVAAAFIHRFVDGEVVEVGREPAVEPV